MIDDWISSRMSAIKPLQFCIIQTWKRFQISPGLQQKLILECRQWSKSLLIPVLSFYEIIKGYIPFYFNSINLITYLFSPCKMISPHSAAYVSEMRKVSSESDSIVGFGEEGNATRHYTEVRFQFRYQSRKFIAKTGCLSFISMKKSDYDQF